MNLSDLKNEVIPSMALVIYKVKNKDGAYMESHPIIKNPNWDPFGSDGQYTFGAAKPVYLKTLQEIFNFLHFEQGEPISFECGIPSNLLHINIQKSASKFTGAWKQKIGERTLTISNTEDGNKKRSQFKINSKYNIVYVLDDELEVYLDVNGKIYELPLPNIYPDNRVCMGNWKSKNHKTVQRILNDWEHGFWDPAFNTLHRTHKFDWKQWWKEPSLKLLTKLYDNYDEFILDKFKP